MSDKDRTPEALKLAVQLHAGGHGSPRDAMRTADLFSDWLATVRPAKPVNPNPAVVLRLTVNPLTFTQGNPALTFPTTRIGDTMSVQMTDAQEVSYSVQADDSKGFPVADTLTWSESSGGTVVTATPSADGSSCMFTAVAPGSATISVTDGTLSATDSIDVVAGAAASLVLTPGAPADVVPPAPAPVA